MNRLLGIRLQLLSLFTLSTVFAHAQLPVTGTKTVCPTGCDFPTLTRAFDTITTNGLGGAVVLELQPTYVSTSEVFPISPSTNATVTNTITIRPSASVASALTITSTNNLATIRFNGAQYVEFDGRNGGVGVNRFLNIVNANTGDSTSTVVFINGAQNNTVRNCALSARAAADSISAIVLFGAGTGNNSNNTIHNNTISNGAIQVANGIASIGIAGSPNTNNTISDNLISNFRDANNVRVSAIFTSTGTSGWTISNNTIFTPSAIAANTGSRYFFINLTAGSGYTISGNTIGYATSTLTGTMTFTGAGRFRLIALTGGAGTTSSIQGNTFRNINIASSVLETVDTLSAFIGIHVGANATANIGTVTPNIFGNQTTTGNITLNLSANNASQQASSMMLVGGPNCSVSNNTFGSISSISTNRQARLVAIRNIASTGTTTISNNTIGGLIAGSLRIASTTAQIIGVWSTAGSATIENNTIQNLMHTGANVGATNATSAIGIHIENTSTGGQTIRGNLIEKLSNTNIGNGAYGVIGLRYNGPSAGTNLIEKNTIRRLSVDAAGTTGIIQGLTIVAGNTTIASNAVAVGANINGNSITKPVNIRGINDLGGNNNYYFNSVYVHGNGALNNVATFAFITSNTAGTLDIRNNSFSNNRNFTVTNDIAGIKNYCFSSNEALSAGVIPGVTLNFNHYHSSNDSALFRLVSTDYGSLTSWRAAATGHDANSQSGYPLYNSRDLLKPLATSPLGPGTAIGGITTDIQNATRTTNKMGAFEGVGDFAPPDIGHNGALKTNVTTDRTLTARIRDTTGTNTSGPLVPKLYYRKNSNSFNAATGSLSSGNGKDGVWSFVLSTTTMGGLAIGDTVLYYIIAQDTSVNNNITSNQEGVNATDVNTIISAPVSLYSYRIVDAANNVYTVCDTCDFTSLTESGATGAFDVLNNTIFTSNVELLIYDSLDENGVVAFNGEALGGFRLTIKPGYDTVFTISNSANLSQTMIRINKASNVTINGSYDGSKRNLRFINTNTTAGNCQAVLAFDDGCSIDTIKNSIIESNATNGARYPIIIGQTGSNTRIVISGNLIRGSVGSPGTVSTAGVVGGILSNSVSNSKLTIGGNNSVDGNEITNFSTNGVFLQSSGDSCTIRNNFIYRNLDRNGASTCISVTNGNGHVISNNNIGGNATNRSGVAFTIRGTNTLTAISVNLGIVGQTTIQNNTISNFGAANQTDAILVNGILVNGGNILVSNNTIGGGTNPYDTVITSSTFAGISLAGTAQIIGIVENNTISNISHYRSASVAVYGINFSNTNVSSTFTIRRNIIQNIRGNSSSVSDAAHPIGIYLAATNTTGNTVDSNIISGIQNAQTIAATRVAGIRSVATAGGATISRNRIYNLSQPNQTSNYDIWGILATGSNTLVFANNYVSLSATAGTPVLYGLSALTTGGTTNIFYNNLYVGGSASAGSSKSYALFKNSSSTIVARNNICYNERSGGSGGHFSIGINSTTGFTSSNNVMISASASAVGEVVTTSYNFADYNTNSGQTNSKNGLSANYPAASFFASTSTGNLASTNCISSNSGTVVSITTDYAGSTRSASFPDIGANEFASVQNTWTGATSTNYSLSSNWCAAAVPSATDTFTIAVASNQPALSSSTTIHTVTLNTGARLDLNGFALTLNGTLSGLGTIRSNAASSMIINGAGHAGTIRIDQSNPGTTNTVGAFTLNRGTTPASGSVTLLGTLRIEDSLVITNGTLNTGDSVVLLSSVSKTARIAQMNTTNAAITGQVVAQRFISSQGRRWRFFASPVQGATVADLKNEIHITGPGTGTTIGTENSNGFDATPANVSSIFSYNEPVSGGVNNGWVSPSGKTDSLRVGRGYRVFVRGPRSEGNGLLDGSILTQNAVTVDLRGTPNFGNYKPVVTFTNTGTPSADGWNLLGNPYASPISWNAIHDAGRTGSFPNYSGTDYSNLSPVVYVLNAVANKYDSYNANSDTGTLTGGLIPSMSSFFVIAQAGTAELNLRESHKSDGTPVNIFKSSSGNGVGIKLYENGSEFDHFIFKPFVNATPILDGYDIPKLNNPNLNISSWGVDGRFLSLDCRPLENDTVRIPLSVRVSKTGLFHFEMNGAEHSGYDAFLEDRFTKTKTLVGTNTPYAFTVSTDTNSTGDFRFTLVFTKSATSTIQPISVPLFKVIAFPNPVSDKLNIAYYNNSATQLKFELFDMAGKCFENKMYQTLSEGLLTIDAQSLASGVYLVRITTLDGIVLATEKIVK